MSESSLTPRRIRPKTVAFYSPRPSLTGAEDSNIETRNWRQIADSRSLLSERAQPQLPGEFGLYRGTSVSTFESEVRMARRFGIDAFCFMHQWPAPSSTDDDEFDAVWSKARSTFPFMLCWVIDEQLDVQATGISTNSMNRPYHLESHIEYLLRVLADPRYLRLGDRPVVAMKSPEFLSDPELVISLWRQRAKDAGFGDLFLCSFAQPGPITSGFDALIDNPAYGENRRVDHEVSLGNVDHLLERRDISGRNRSAMREFHCVLPRWRGTSMEGSHDVKGATWSPEEYRQRLSMCLGPQDFEDLTFIKSWNDWSDGSQLMPDGKWGRAFLDAHAAAINPSLTPEFDDVRGVLLKNRIVLDSFEDFVARLHADGQLEDALRLMRAGCDWACHQTAALSSERFEEIVSEIGKIITRDLPTWSKATPHGKRRTLHILTEAHSIGGHTRLAQRWAEFDDGSEHSVLLTSQGTLELPSLLASAFEGRISRLPQAGLLEQVRELNRIATQFDMVVLHIHPYDVVAVAAMADHSRRPPTIFVNHADHIFWLGIGASDQVVNLFPVGARYSKDLRGISSGRCKDLPIPVELHERSVGRPEAKQLMSISQSAIIALTMASAYKYASVWDPSFIVLVTQALTHNQQFHLVAIGVGGDVPSNEQDSEWHMLAQTFPGRVHLMGTMDDCSIPLQAADLYLDSFPHSSPTSVLEAALYAMPVVAFDPYPGAELFGFTDFDFVPLVARTPEDWQSFVDEIISDALERKRIGNETKTTVEAHHGRSAWRSQVQSTYSAVVHGAAELPSCSSDVVPSRFDMLYRAHLRSGIVRDVASLLDHHGILPRNDADRPTDSSSAMRIDISQFEKFLQTSRESMQRAEYFDGELLSKIALDLGAQICESFHPESIRDVGWTAGLLSAHLEQSGVSFHEMPRITGEPSSDENPGFDSLELLSLLSDGYELRDSVDLTICVGSLCQLPIDDAIVAIASLAQHTTKFLWTPIPVGLSDHVFRNSRSRQFWVEAFVACGMFPCPSGDLDSVVPGALLFSREHRTPFELITDYETEFALKRAQTLERERQLIAERDQARHQQHLTWLGMKSLSDELVQLRKSTADIDDSQGG